MQDMVFSMISVRLLENDHIHRGFHDADRITVTLFIHTDIAKIFVRGSDIETLPAEMRLLTPPIQPRLLMLMTQPQLLMITVPKLPLLLKTLRKMRKAPGKKTDKIPLWVS